MSIRLKTDFKSSPPRPFRRKNGIYYIRDRSGYRDIWRSCRTKVLKEAQAYAYAFWFKRQSATVKEMVLPPRAFIEKELELYQVSENFKSLKPSTRHTRLLSINMFMNYCAENKIIFFDDLTVDFCESFLGVCGNSASRFNNVRGDMIKACEHTCKRLSIENPFEKISYKKRTGKNSSAPKTGFTDNDIKKILEYYGNSSESLAGEWLKACKIAMWSGLRYKDIALLRHDSITSDTLELKPNKTDSTVNKKILLRVPFELQKEFFKTSNHNSEYILPGLAGMYPVYDNTGKFISGRRNPTSSFSKALKILNIKAPDGYSIGFHSFRATFITKLRQAGYSAEVIKGIVGHTEALQTEYYNRAAILIDINKISYA